MKSSATSLLLVLFVTSLALAQSGPHTPVSPITSVKPSSDGKRMMTTSWGDVAVWNLDDYSLIRSFDITSLGIPLSDDYKFAADPKMNTIWVKPFSKRQGAVVDIDKWTTHAAPNENISFISGNGLGVSWGGDNRTNLVDLVKGTSTEIEEFKEGDFPEMSPDGMMMSTQVGKKRKSKTYDFSTGKVVAGHFQEMQKINTKRSYWASVGEKTFTNWPSQKAYPMKYGSTPGVPAQLVWDDADRIIVWENKNDRNYSKYENFVVVYNRNTGEVIKEIPLNRSQEEAKKIREAEEEAQRKRQAEADAARQEKMANAKPGFKKFDASFRDLGLPFTMDYNSAQGFSLGGDAFINSDMGLRSGSEIYGMGRICSCNDNSTYLLMVRNKTSTTDLSNFIIVSFDIGGNRVGSRTIGATQKDPSGITRLDFTISNAYCGAQVKAATTYSNGNKEDKSFSFGGCRVN